MRCPCTSCTSSTTQLLVTPMNHTATGMSYQHQATASRSRVYRHGHAQAAAFSLSVQYFSLPVPEECLEDSLKGLPWLPILTTDTEQLSPEERSKHVAIRHTLANRAVGIMCARLRLDRANAERTNVYAPPLAMSIPFLHQMDLPLPFSHDSLERFGQCHLQAMTDPTFFTDDI